MNLSNENLVLKKINGEEVKCKDLVEFFKAYIEIFKGDEMPEPKSMLIATSEANNLASLSAAKDAYISLMESVCGGDKPYINEHILDMEHCKIKDQALEVFGSRRKMGGEEFSKRYMEQLESEIAESYSHYIAHNESKNIFKAANTPITLAAIACICYVIGNIFALVGLYPIANLLNLVLMTSFLLLAAWGYTKYSGNATEIGVKIDQIASMAWDNAIQPAMNTAAVRGSEFAARQAVQRLNSTTVPPNSANLIKKNT